MLPMAQSLTIAGVMLSFYALDTLFIRYYDRQRQADGSGRSWDYTLFILVAVSAIILQPWLLPVLSVPLGDTLGWVLWAAGVGMILLAFALHFSSRVHLRHFYAERVEIQPEHRIIDTGPYAYIRHPVFTSFFMIALGLVLINLGLLTLLIFVYALWDFSRAAMAEEAIMVENLPAYAQYMQRTGRFLPRVF